MEFCVSNSIFRTSEIPIIQRTFKSALVAPPALQPVSDLKQKTIEEPPGMSKVKVETKPQHVEPVEKPCFTLFVTDFPPGKKALHLVSFVFV
jgi:hypothetical protein